MHHPHLTFAAYEILYDGTGEFQTLKLGYRNLSGELRNPSEFVRNRAPHRSAEELRETMDLLPEASEGDVQGTRRHDEREWWKNRRRRRAILASRLRVASSHVVALLLSCQETKGTAHTSRRLTDDRIGGWQHGKDKNPTPRTRSRGGMVVRLTTTGGEERQETLLRTLRTAILPSSGLLKVRCSARLSHEVRLL